MQLPTAAHQVHEAMSEVYRTAGGDEVTHKDAAKTLSVLTDSVKLLEQTLKKLSDRAGQHTCRPHGARHRQCEDMHNALFRAFLHAARTENVLHSAAGTYQEALGRVLPPTAPIDQ